MSMGLALLPLKMALAAFVVVVCSLLAERSGPLVAAMIATLPISLGPVLVFLALDHDAAFIAGSALGTMNANLTHAGFVLSYVLLAQRHGVLLSLGGAFAIWIVLLLAIRSLGLTAVPLALLTVLAFLIVHRLVRPYLAVRAKPPSGISRSAIPVRAACVAALVGIVSGASGSIGPQWSGILAGLPIILSSLIIILHRRAGGPAAAAVIGSSALGLLGAGLGLAAVNLTAVPWGSWTALGLGLAIAVLWNLILLGLSRRAAP
ncbi:hypothetical protein [Bosea sp. (in: a-proteobacteria)]|uniref:hypothetical protein n=1 Tax=Bosea sp. (in: a-proteobacteria) TaxID=1871050 RepID=UPI001204CFBA|nr:hypothetical protein [Bosea sp. (in: a-proteobacteria)]TAJ27009.1 MAG: hypothetical protein EPO59_22895 [Bosea sp. (in: a-proteobacteria)]